MNTATAASPRLGTLINIFIGGLDLTAEMFVDPADPSCGVPYPYVSEMVLFYMSETGLHGEAISDEDEALISGKERDRIENDFINGEYDDDEDYSFEGCYYDD